MALAMDVLDQENFTHTNYARLAVACGDFVRRVQIDDVLTPRRWMPVEKPI
jgi:hypothetical protein